MAQIVLQVAEVGHDLCYSKSPDAVDCKRIRISIAQWSMVGSGCQHRVDEDILSS